MKNRNVRGIYLYTMHKFNHLASCVLTLSLAMKLFYTLDGEIISVKQRLLFAYQF